MEKESVIKDESLLHWTKAVILIHTRMIIENSSRRALERIHEAQQDPDENAGVYMEEKLKAFINVNAHNIERAEEIEKIAISYVPKDMRYWPSFN